VGFLSISVVYLTPRYTAETRTVPRFLQYLRTPVNCRRRLQCNVPTGNPNSLCPKEETLTVVFLHSMLELLVTASAVLGAMILSTLMTEMIHSKCQFLQLKITD
jgi:hypothetical protein